MKAEPLATARLQDGPPAVGARVSAEANAARVAAKPGGLENRRNAPFA